MENGSHSTFKLNIISQPKNQRCRRPLTLFSFITATTRDGSQVTEKRLQDASEVLKDEFAKGTALKCKEKNVAVYPIVHFTEDRNALMSVLQDQKELSEHFKLHQGEQITL
uniref:Uncharacterized protein n=1 Tax=Sipha flava TaxID=143950 RepID=A0A2S2QUB9_9HEMI